MEQLPTLGVGIGFREPFRSDLFLHQAEVDFLEITVEHYLDATPEKLKELSLLARHFTLIPHALNLSLGSAEGLDLDYLQKLARLIEQLNPPWWSDHICFTRAGGIDIGHLAPLPYTMEALDVLTANIEQVRRYIKTPLILENITYMLALPGEMTEAEFVRRLLERTDCGFLLDVTNLFINASNHGYDWREFLAQLPMERVVQLHFVGGEYHGDLLIDSHSQPTQDEIWAVMAAVLADAPVKGIILERDENLPGFTTLLQELANARALGKQYKLWD